ncbi:hypothetical protein QP938_12330 [Porticoccaceae bacterium LTM1]|nr:hypothetical protein QP938_12330 [Porticoccaceae bacterium LTM1]
MMNMMDVWSQSQELSGIPFPVELEFVVPYPVLFTTLDGSLTLGSLLQELDTQSQHMPGPSDPGSELNWRRAQFKADVVLVFTGTPSPVGICGKAKQPLNWNLGAGGFLPLDPDIPGTDRRYKDTHFYGVIATSQLCINNQLTAAHELGHILGAGHYSSSGLYSDSRGYHATSGIFGENVYTVMTSVDDLPEETWRDYEQVKTFSHNNFAFHGDDDHENHRAVGTTAFSVANYYTAPPEPEPAVLVPPINLSGILLGHCDPPPYTHHLILWEEGGSTAQYTHFEVWYSQPIGPYLVYGWSTGLSEFTQSYVYGADALVVIRVCDDQGNCSDFSESFFIANWSCYFQ